MTSVILAKYHGCLDKTDRIKTQHFQRPIPRVPAEAVDGVRRRLAGNGCSVWTRRAAGNVQRGGGRVW